MEIFSNSRVTSYSCCTFRPRTATPSAAAPIRALAAVVESPVAVASAERGPAKGISGDPYEVTGFDI